MRTRAGAYRADIDGLRAVSVLAILAYHFFPALFPGGFIGVDVFFVISGYLITKILCRENREGIFSLARFYGRRVRRIFPALLLVLVFCFALGKFVLFAPEFRLLCKHVAASSVFLNNILLARESGYFQPASATKPLLHLWSLGVEEQFYIVWPLMLLLCFRWGRRGVGMIALGLLILASYLWHIRLAEESPAGSFYLPHARAWELWVGAALAHEKARLPWQSSSALGIALVIAGIFFRHESIYFFPGWSAVLPSLGAALVIAAGPSAWANRRLLSVGWLAALGRISYPLYLWHWPLFSFALLWNFEPPGGGLSFALLGLSLFLSILTAQGEKTFREEGREKIKAAFLVFALGCVGLFSYLSYRGIGQGPLGERDAYLASFEASAPAPAYRPECDFYDSVRKKPRQEIAPSCFTPESRNVIFIWGDSYAQHLNEGLQKIFGKNFSFLQVATSGCRPTIGEIPPDPHGACQRSNQFALQAIAAAKPRLLLLAQRDGYEAQDWEGMVSKLQRLGVEKVLLVGPAPQWHSPLPRILARRFWPHPPERISVGLKEGLRDSEEGIRTLAPRIPDFKYISLWDALCDARGCLAVLGGDPREGIFTRDDGHFTSLASHYVAEKALAPVLREWLAP